MDKELLVICGVFLFVIFICGWGASNSKHIESELENGCIVYEDKIYCEEIIRS